jgi:hypothetical protein
MDPNFYTRYSKYHIKTVNEFPNDLDSCVRTPEMRSLVQWFKNLSEQFTIVKIHFERCILILDKIPSLEQFELIYQKVILLSTLQVCIKLSGAYELDPNEFNNIINNVKDEISPVLGRKEINMAEIYLCNYLNWEFRSEEFAGAIRLLTTRVEKISNIIDLSYVSSICDRILSYGLVYFNSSQMPPHILALATTIMSLDQISLPVLPATKLIKDLISFSLEKYGICLNKVKLTKERLYQYIISTQEYPIVIRYSERAINEYKDNLYCNNSCEVSKRSYIDVFNQLDLQEPINDLELSFSDDLKYGFLWSEDFNY